MSTHASETSQQLGSTKPPSSFLSCTGSGPPPGQTTEGCCQTAVLQRTRAEVVKLCAWLCCVTYTSDCIRCQCQSPAALQDLNRVRHVPPQHRSTPPPLRHGAQKLQPRCGLASSSNHQLKEHRAQRNRLSSSLTTELAKSRLSGSLQDRPSFLEQQITEDGEGAGRWSPRCARPVSYTFNYTRERSAKPAQDESAGESGGRP